MLKIKRIGHNVWKCAAHPNHGRNLLQKKIIPSINETGNTESKNYKEQELIDLINYKVNINNTLLWLDSRIWTRDP